MISKWFSRYRAIDRGRQIWNTIQCKTHKSLAYRQFCLSAVGILPFYSIPWSQAERPTLSHATCLVPTAPTS